MSWKTEDGKYKFAYSLQPKAQFYHFITPFSSVCVLFS